MIAKALVSNRSEVAILTLATEPRIKKNLTTNWDNISQNLNAIEIKGKINFISGIRTAFSALKNKAKDNMELRIILFVSSGVESDVQEFIDLAKNLREEKLKPVIQIISFGINNEANHYQLSTFILLLQNKDSCLLTIAETQFLKTLLIGSPILDLSVGQFKQEDRSFWRGIRFRKGYKFINRTTKTRRRNRICAKKRMRFALKFEALGLDYAKTNNNRVSEDMLLQKAMRNHLKILSLIIKLKKLVFL